MELTQPPGSGDISDDIIKLARSTQQLVQIVEKMEKRLYAVEKKNEELTARILSLEIERTDSRWGH